MAPAKPISNKPSFSKQTTSRPRDKIPVRFVLEVGKLLGGTGLGGTAFIDTGLGTAVVNTGHWELLWMVMVGVGTALLWVLGMGNFCY
jgi:hypothetical protein